MAALVKTLELFSPLIQLGFAGFSMMLLAVIVWLMRNMFRLSDRTQDLMLKTMEVIKDNTVAIHELTALSRDSVQIQRSVHDRLLSRPCIAHKD